MKPLFQTSFLGSKVKIYPQYLSYCPFFGLVGEKTIPIDKIASVYLDIFYSPHIIIETSGGKRINLLVKFKHKKRIKDFIYEIKKEP